MMEFLLGASTWAFRRGERAFARGWPLWVLWALLLAGLVVISVTLAQRRIGWARSSVWRISRSVELSTDSSPTTRHRAEARWTVPFQAFNWCTKLLPYSDSPAEPITSTTVG